MKIAVTRTAQEKLKEKTAGKEGYGVDSDDREISTEAGSIYIEKSKEVFFDESMTIDYSDQANCFQLKSPNQYLNPRMSFINKIS